MKYRIIRRVEGDIYLLDERQKVYIRRVKGRLYRRAEWRFFGRGEVGLKERGL